MTKPTTEHAVVPLETPIKRGEQEIKEITLRKPKSGELRGLNLNDVLNSDVNAMHKLLPRISTPTLTEKEVSDLEVADFVQVCTETVGFFMTQAQKASLPL